MSRKYLILVFLLIGLLIVNTVVHFSHPAYRFYRQNCEDLKKQVESAALSLRSDYDVFTKRVQVDFVPSILTVFSNRCEFASVSSNGTVGVVGSSSGDDYKPDIITARYFVAGGKGWLDYDGWQYTAGDDFFGYTILEIRPSLVITDGRVFILQRPRSPDRNVDVSQLINQLQKGGRK